MPEILAEGTHTEDQGAVNVLPIASSASLNTCFEKKVEVLGKLDAW